MANAALYIWRMRRRMRIPVFASGVAAGGGGGGGGSTFFILGF